MIEIRNGDVVRAGQRTFHEFNWKISSGEHWVITGINGSGKTTLLDIIAGVIHVSKGHVHYDFVNGTTWEERFQERQANICYIPVQAIHAFVNASHDVYYQQRYYATTDESLPRVRTILGDDINRLHELNIPPRFDVTSLLDVEVTRLSNGQLKKIVILKNLLRQMPRLLLLDYPFEGLDYESRADLCNFLDYIAVTHNVQVILTDHHHHLPTVINKKLVLDNFKILREETVQTSVPEDREEFFKTRLPLATKNDPVVEMRDLCIQYGNKIIIDNFSWMIRKGERWALVGRNGSGKTTIFSLIYADHPMAYSQQVYLFGRRRGSGESIWDIKRRINYVGPELNNYLNPKSILATALDYIRGLHKKMNEVVLDHLISHFNAASFMYKPVRSLSSGQLQLMQLINCFLSDKELLLLDEPFQFLDVHHKELVQQYIQSHLHADRTLVLITHYQEDIVHWTSNTMSLQ